MKINVSGDVKNIPRKYGIIENIEDYIDDLHSPRLSDTERENLNIQLLKQQMSDVITKIKNTPGLRDIIQVSEPVKAIRIKTRTETYHVIRFANGKEIRCKPGIFKSSPVKEEINRLY